GQDSFYDRAARKLRQSELLIQRWSPDNRRMELDRYLWRDQPHLGLKQLWEYLARYCYLPRLYNEDVLLEAVSDGVVRHDAPFGYATMVGPEGVYKGLTFGHSTSIYFDDNAVIVRPEIAQEQPPAQTSSSEPSPSSQDRPYQATEPLQPRLITRYHGTVS